MTEEHLTKREKSSSSSRLSIQEQTQSLQRDSELARIRAKLQEPRFHQLDVSHFPQSVAQNLKHTVPGYLAITPDEVLFEQNGKKVHMKIGRALQKWSPSLVNAYQTWKSRANMSNIVVRAIQRALEARDRHNRLAILSGFVGEYPVPDTRYKIVISQAPINLFLKSTCQSWEQESCERLGGSYGNPVKWLADRTSCGFCSDIEHGNAVLGVVNTETEEWIGRQMLRWGETGTAKKVCLGVEPRWYGNLPAGVGKFKKQLLTDLSTKTGVPLATACTAPCRTPYTYAGYSDAMQAGNTKITYSAATAEKGVSAVALQIQEHLEAGAFVYFYDYGHDVGNYKIKSLERIDHELPLDEIGDLLQYYDHWTTNLDDIRDALQSDYIYNTPDVRRIRDLDDLKERVSDDNKHVEHFDEVDMDSPTWLDQLSQNQIIDSYERADIQNAITLLAEGKDVVYDGYANTGDRFNEENEWFDTVLDDVIDDQTTNSEEVRQSEGFYREQEREAQEAHERYMR
jgi:hypothetical protein